MRCAVAHLYDAVMAKMSSVKLELISDRNSGLFVDCSYYLKLSVDSSLPPLSVIEYLVSVLRNYSRHLVIDGGL